MKDEPRGRDPGPAPGEQETARDTQSLDRSVETAAIEGNLALREILEQRTAELEERTAEVAQLRGQLRSEVQRLNEVTSEVDELGRRDAERADFVAMAAHDLRNPATVLSASTLMLRDQWESFSEEQKVSVLDHMLVNADVLYRLTEDLLQVSQIDSGSVECRREPFALAAVIRYCVEDIALAMHFSDFVVEIEDGLPAALGDEQRTVQVLYNLITNAVKYGGTQASVFIRAVRHDSSSIRVDISDNGPGISKRDMEKLFKRFTRLQHDRKTPTKGTGLGLYIASSLVEALGGQIWVNSRRGTGSTFSFTLPAIFDVHGPVEGSSR